MLSKEDKKVKSEKTDEEPLDLIFSEDDASEAWDQDRSEPKILKQGAQGSLIFLSNPLAKPNAIVEYSPFSH
jgi:hypothetical protein